ncbi:GGDEF domain-containing protein [Cupriavidus basilensis]|uniref:GGDEF domain-containing protein n=1 Tax=Cupriavidus basilensis TaxID=68895 RepID=UPI0023E82B3D|nr:GGDEF domain-containing protein [Cupriavidus basilensis]MDF3887072.1 GGDEF domain-containing protein [Cupriavidus basilensis]
MMFRTIESRLLNKPVPAPVQTEFAQHEFERLQRFCLMIFAAGAGIWLVFDLLLSFQGVRGFTVNSTLNLALLSALTVGVAFVRRAQQFQVISFAFVAAFCGSARLVLDRTPDATRPIWSMLVATSVLFCASSLPLSNRAFFGVIALAWVLLFPAMTVQDLLELKGVLILCYTLYFTGITVYTFVRLRRAKLQNFVMAKTLLQQAYVDALTEIPNRRAFMLNVGNLVPRATEEQDHYLAMVDVDDFKKVNDRYGHDIGDEVLKHVAAGIKLVMGDCQYARLGGEEFGIYLKGMTRAEVEIRIGLLCRSIRDAASEPPVTISIGVTHLVSGDTLTTALIKADEALYDSKRTGKDKYTFHQEPCQPEGSP